jgi:hypothetical protein
MRHFTDVVAAYGLKEFVQNPFGTTYFRPDAYDRHELPLIVRHADGELSRELVPPYIDLWGAAQEWIDSHPELAKFVRLQAPLEVGHDFVARQHHVFTTSTASYADSEDPPEPPPELALMRAAFTAVSNRALDDRARLIVALLSRSIIEPSSKTFFKGKEGRFIILEPRLTRSDIERWRELNHS